MSARILDCTDLEYLNDPCTRPSLSKSIANILCLQSPLHAWSAHPRLGGVKLLPTQAVNDGTILHKLILGKGAELEVIHCDAYRTNVAKQRRDDAYEAGMVPVKIAEYEAAIEVAARVKDSLAAAGYPLNGESEVAIEWTEEANGEEILCRCKMDHLHQDTALILDLKKLRSVNENEVTRSFEEYGSDIQYVAYRRAFRALRPELAVPTMVFLTFENTPPYAVHPIEPDALWEDIGNLRWDLAKRTWQECLAKGSWRGYGGLTPTIITPPTWVRRRYLGDEYDMSDIGLVQ